MKKILISSIVVLIVTTIRHFIFKINKPKKDMSNPHIQKVPDTIAIASWVIFVAMIMVSLLTLITCLNTPNTQKDTEFSIFSSFLSILFFIIFLYMRLIAMHTTYAEYSDHLIFIVRTKKTRINYSEIQKFYFSEQKFIIIIDKNRQKIKINLVWFRPRILFQTLVDSINNGDFDHLGDYDTDQFLLELARLQKRYRI